MCPKFPPGGRFISAGTRKDIRPVRVREIFRIMKRIHKEARASILLGEQNAIAALSVAEYGYKIENGQVVLDGPAAQLKDNEGLQEFYLGFSQMGLCKCSEEVQHYKRRKRWLR